MPEDFDKISPTRFSPDRFDSYTDYIFQTSFAWNPVLTHIHDRIYPVFPIVWAGLHLWYIQNQDCISLSEYDCIRNKSGLRRLKIFYGTLLLTSFSQWCKVVRTGLQKVSGNRLSDLSKIVIFVFRSIQARNDVPVNSISLLIYFVVHYKKSK